MSDTSAPSESQIAIASFDRMLAETGRMLAETRKFSAEQNKLASEQTQLQAEARKFDRERWAVYATAVGGLIGGTAGIVTMLKAAGW